MSDISIHNIAEVSVKENRSDYPGSDVRWTELSMKHKDGKTISITLFHNGIDSIGLKVAPAIPVGAVSAGTAEDFIAALEAR